MCDHAPPRTDWLYMTYVYLFNSWLLITYQLQQLLTVVLKAIDQKSSSSAPNFCLQLTIRNRQTIPNAVVCEPLVLSFGPWQLVSSIECTVWLSELHPHHFLLPALKSVAHSALSLFHSLQYTLLVTATKSASLQLVWVAQAVEVSYELPYWFLHYTNSFELITIILFAYVWLSTALSGISDCHGPGNPLGIHYQWVAPGQHGSARFWAPSKPRIHLQAPFSFWLSFSFSLHCFILSLCSSATLLTCVPFSL